MSTETLDKLYLEWSQFTKAKTERELNLEKRIKELELALSGKSQLYCQCGGVKNTQWRDIETAPKDGTEIIIFIPEAYDPVDIASWYLNEFHGNHWMRARCVDEGNAGNPTHWMPLPEHPLSTNPDTNKP